MGDQAWRKISLSRLRPWSHGSQSGRAVARQWAFDRLVIQMADRAICFGGGIRVMVPDSAQRRRDHQQREQRHGNDHAPS